MQTTTPVPTETTESSGTASRQSRPGPAEGAIRVLLVDDHAVVLSAMHLLINSCAGMTVVGEARNGAEALALATREQPEIILLDLCLGSENGTDLIAELLELVPGARVILLTAVQDEGEFRRAIRMGAMGVVSKGASADFLLKAIERVNAGELWLNRQATASLVHELRQTRNGDSEEKKEEDIGARLTGREREIVALIAEGLRNKQIADRLCISEPTVRHHLTSILRKMGVADRMELLILAYRHNLVAIKR